MSKTFVIGDIHGAHKALEQCLERCGFDFENDTLITLGDICDGWPYVYECVELLLKCKHRIDIIGNHCDWFRRWLITGSHPDGWGQGGKGTASSYLRMLGKDVNAFTTEKHHYPGYGYFRTYRFDLAPDEIPDTHKAFFENQKLYYKDELNRVFTHAGFNPDISLKENQRIKPDIFYWDRGFWNRALYALEDDFNIEYKEEIKEVFIGHTETTSYTQFNTKPGSFVLIPGNLDNCPPVHADIIWNIDTGAGSTGKLTIMDVDTHEYWQSDLVSTFYGEYKPRG